MAGIKTLLRIEKVLVAAEAIVGVCCLNLSAPENEHECSLLLMNGKTINIQTTLAKIEKRLERAGFRILHTTKTIMAKPPRRRR